MPNDGSDSSRPDPGPRSNPIGQVFGDRYDVREELGSGAFAVTYRGWDLRLGRAVAIKVLRDTHASEPTPVQRFEREARAAASVSQANVVDVYDVGRHGDQLYIVMQYVQGEDLKHLIVREGPLSPRRAAHITLQILAGLAAIHEAGIIHRDIKPQNVLIGRDDVARVTDFGIAHVTVEAGLTTAGTTFGTASYMAPEQAEAGTLVEATDLYSVGVVLYEMLTARLPFEAPTMIALILAHIQTVPSPPSVRAPAQHITPELDAVVMRALEKRPENRFRDAPAMIQAVSAAMAHVPVGMDATHVITTGDEETIKTTSRRPHRAADTLPPSAARPGTRAAMPSGIPGRGVRPGRRVLPFVLLILLLAGVAGGGAYLASLDGGGDPPGEDLRGIVADLDVSPTPTARATEVPTASPTPTDVSTEVPVPTELPPDTPVPTIAPTDTPVPTAVPTATPPPVTPTDPPVPTPTDVPEPTPTEAQPLIVPRDSAGESDEAVEEESTAESSLSAEDGNSGAIDAEGPGTVTLSFTASDWQGAYFQETGNQQPWSAIYAQSTGYGSGSLTFDVDGTPASDTFSLTVDGMTSENWPELPMSLLINGEEVYEGTSPFPTWNGIEGEQPWATVNVDLPTSVLQQGENTVTFVNLEDQGEFSRPPYILLAGGTLTIELDPGG